MGDQKKDVFENWTFVHELGEGAFGEFVIINRIEMIICYFMIL